MITASSAKHSSVTKDCIGALVLSQTSFPPCFSPHALVQQLHSKDYSEKNAGMHVVVEEMLWLMPIKCGFGCGYGYIDMVTV